MYKWKKLFTFYTPTGQVINTNQKNLFLSPHIIILSSTSFALLKKLNSLKLQQKNSFTTLSTPL